ncbi:MFS transporter [Acinetobacter sp. VNH17]|uniref:MFS transporter n=1 Tax=Acinetobacter thutiue TaxID=2998078 RepID=A0ABT7WMY1_9GAMM|nr:MFS transporter [Acinetobacter thutiue]MCY6411932.1 MFS transporter [Acinetobacter thutiue]MDN0014036.1 MFS transporter [Acinetobacter thutiue]
MNTQAFFDSKGHIFALCLFAAIGPLVMMTTPVLAYQLATEWQFAPSQVGTFFFYEQIFMGIAALPAIYWAKRYSPQKVMKVFILLFILGNFLSLFANSLTTLVLARSSAAFAAGSIMIVTMASCSMTSKPARTFALWLLGQTIFGALAILVLPHLFAQFGLKAFFVLLIVLMLIATPFYKQFSNEVPQAPQQTEQHANHPSSLSIIWSIIGVASVLSFFMSISSIWTFLTSIGLNSNIPEASINGYLSFATLFGILGCFVATFIGHRVSRIVVVIIGFILFFISLFLMLGTIAASTFMTSIVVFKFAWMFTFPFILASLAMMDHTGSIMKYVSLMIAIGMGVGPGISGQIIEQTASFNTLIMYAMAMFVISLVLVTLLNGKFRKHQNGAQANSLAH